MKLKQKLLLAVIPMVLINTNVALAEVAAGNTIATTLAGTGCAAGPVGTEYASSSYTFTNPPPPVAHGVFHDGDTITQTVAFSLAAAVDSLPAACDNIALTLALTKNTASIGNNLTFTSLALDGATDATAANVTVGSLKTGLHELTLTLAVDTGNSTDMAEAISYSIPVTVSLKTKTN